MGMLDPDRSISGDSFRQFLAGDSPGSDRLHRHDTLARLWTISASIFHRPGWRSAVRRIGFMALLLPQLGRVGRWLRCAGNPLLSAEMHSSPFVLRAMHRPYVNKDWNLAQRLEAIEQHYLALLDRAALLNLAGTQYFDLLRLGPEYQDLRVVVDRPGWMRGEGEVSVSLFHRNNRVYAAMFLIAGEPPNRRLVIGAFQGWSNAAAKEIYVQLTHALHGLRPRDFLLDLLKMVAESIGCIQIWGVADANHRATHALVRTEKHVSYDEVWREHGGQLNGQGFYVMPAELRLREIGQVPSKKRAQYRRRYELLEELRQQIRRVFAQGERSIKEHGRNDEEECATDTFPNHKEKAALLSLEAQEQESRP